MPFDQLTAEKLHNYVYALENQMTNTIFYIGKGKGNRIFSHQEGILKNIDMYNGENSSEKNNEIARILQQGQNVKAYIIRWNLNEEEALKLESALIDLLQLNKCFDLKNIIRGNQTEYGVTSADEITSRYNATPLLESEIKDKIMFININKQYFECFESGQINFDKLYDKTRYAWPIAPWRANQAKYICTVYRGIVKATFLKNGNWFPSYEEDVKSKNGTIKKRTRYAFTGARFEASPYDNKNVSAYYKKGSQGAVKYTY